MVVHVVYARSERRWRAGDRFRGAIASKRPLRRAVTANATAAAAPAVAPSSGFLSPVSLSRDGGYPLRAASPSSPAPVTGPVRREHAALCCGSEEEWEEVVAEGAEAAAPICHDEAEEDYEFVFGAPPTDDEVRTAVASIQRVFENQSALTSDALELEGLALPISGHPSSGIFVNHFSLDFVASEIGLEEWPEPTMLVPNSSALLTREHRNVLDAFHLLQEDSSVQKMVMALSTDKTVWDAVMNNEVVQEFKRSFQDGKETDPKDSSTASPGLLNWVLENSQAKIKEFLVKMLQLVNLLFQAEDSSYDSNDDIVRTSFMLSVFVFIVVAMARMR